MSKQYNMKAVQGFTLVELSIVIVIIGFLVAGIAAGANMVKQAEIRSVISDLQSYQTAYNNFISKYNKAPGDMDTASSFWTGGACASNSDTDCNGNGNGKIETSTTFPAGDEVRIGLKQLALANMISAGIPVVGSAITGLVAGTNAPTSKISGAGYYLVSGTLDTAGALVSPYSASTNIIVLGKATKTPTTDNENLINGALKPEDAFSIDQKLDDAIVTTSNDSPFSAFISSANASAALDATTFSGASTGNVRAINASDAATGSNCVDTGGVTYIVATTTSACLLGLALN